MVEIILAIEKKSQAQLLLIPKAREPAYYLLEIPSANPHARCFNLDATVVSYEISHW